MCGWKALTCVGPWGVTFKSNQNAISEIDF